MYTMEPLNLNLWCQWYANQNLKNQHNHLEEENQWSRINRHKSPYQTKHPSTSAADRYSPISRSHSIRCWRFAGSLYVNQGQMKYSVEPLYYEHLWNWPQVVTIERLSYYGGSNWPLYKSLELQIVVLLYRWKRCS